MKTLTLLALLLAWQAPVPRTTSTSDAAKLRQPQGPTEAQVARLVADYKACDASVADTNAKVKEGRLLTPAEWKAKVEAANLDIVVDAQTFKISVRVKSEK